MVAQRIYKQTSISNTRAAGMKNLWEPVTTYQGKPQDKPSYLFSCIIPKTRAHWSEEAPFAAFAQAANELYQQALSHIPFAQIVWPVKDGDMPPEYGKPPIEWCKGHWFLSGSSSSQIETNIVEAGVPVKIMNRVKVKPGDYCSVGGALAVKTNMPNGVKFFINSVLFLAPGEELAIGNGNSISGAELMAKAKEQGLNVTGFGGGVSSGGFGEQPAQQLGFTTQQPVVTPSVGLALTGNGFGGAPAPLQPPQGQFTTPGGFTPPPGFPQR